MSKGTEMCVCVGGGGGEAGCSVSDRSLSETPYKLLC